MRGPDGYAAIEHYALIGDGRTAALVARDGSIDWLCLPDFDSPSVFSRVLDAENGGAFELAPSVPYESEREYVPGTNVLTTVFRTADGAARVTDGLTLADRANVAPMRELVRKIEGVAGDVTLEWRVTPRFDYARRDPRISRRGPVVVAESGRTALAVTSGDDEVRVSAGSITGTARVRAGESTLVAMTAADREPLVFAGRRDAERRLERTIDFWRSWTRKTEYDGPWGELVQRSALVLKLLVFAPSAAIVAAPTTSIPEWIGGARNWDYRYTWTRDAALTLVALLRLGHRDEARAFFWWLSHATALTQPELKVLYRLNGAVDADEQTLDHLDGYRRSRPVRVGNGAAAQTQLDVYGEVLDALWQFAEDGVELSRHERKAAAEIADWVAANWRRPDAGIWEVRVDPAHFTHSKAMCWVALDRASRLLQDAVSSERVRRWRDEARAIRSFVDAHAWDVRQSTYVRTADDAALDASLLLLSLFEYDDPRGNRIASTIDAVQRELREGVRVRRYRADDGVGGDEGGFLACSFWLVAALAKAGRPDDARDLMDELAGAANDVGLYAEGLAPDGSFLGNFPQALTHLALVSAALTVEDAAAAS
jgi:GH15 family glucan-1,4-alpha-glucosidase